MSTSTFYLKTTPMKRNSSENPLRHLSGSYLDGFILPKKDSLSDFTNRTLNGKKKPVDPVPDPTHFIMENFPLISGLSPKQYAKLGSDPIYYSLPKLLRFKTFDHSVFRHPEMKAIIAQLMIGDEESQAIMAHISKGLFTRDLIGPKGVRKDPNEDPEFRVFLLRIHCSHDCSQLISKLVEEMPRDIFEYAMKAFIKFNPVIAQFIQEGGGDTFSLMERIIYIFPSELKFLLRECGLMTSNINPFNIEIIVKRSDVETIELLIENLKRVTKFAPNSGKNPFKSTINKFKKIDLRSDFTSEDKIKLESKWKALIAGWESKMAL